MLLLLSTLASSASGHTLYAEFSDELHPDTQADFWIAYGHGGSADAELLSLPVARLISPVDETTDLELKSYKDGFKGTAMLKQAGCYILDMQMESTLFNPSWFGAAGSTSLVQKFGRALMPVASGKGYDWSSGSGLEIVPETDPYELKSGDQFKARVLWNGQPVSGSLSTIITRQPVDVLMVQHAQETELEAESADGSININTTRPGLWVLSFEATIDESGTWDATSDDTAGHYKKSDHLDYEQMAPTAFLSFWVKK
jgi:cobalt/nickel transport protein